MSETLVEPIVTISDAALATILDARNAEIDGGALALWLEVGGSPAKFAYEMYFQPADEAGASDSVTSHGELRVVVPASSVAKLRGATLDIAADGSGMVLSNPNEPKAPPAPTFEVKGTLEGPLAARVMHVIETQVNPGIASHGGFATLLGVDVDTVYLTMGGGCQGCAMSKATLRQGIEVAIKQNVPEIVHVVDMTDHASGATPYYAD